MLSIEFIRQNVQKVKDAAKNKNREVDIERILALDDERRDSLQKVQKLREERNALAKDASAHSRKSGNPHPSVERGRHIKDQLKTLETKQTELETELNTLMSFVPNVPLDEVPVGTDASGNVEIKAHGERKTFDFEPKSHIDLGLALDILDFERGSKVSGFRGYFLKNEGAMLHMAVLFYAFQKLMKRGYTPMIAPAIVKGFTLFGSAQFPWGQDEVYKLNDEDAYLAGTAEIPVTAYYANEILNEKDLPKKFVAFSPCFRREAGSYGKDTKGLYRLHEFWKIEQVILSTNDMNQARTLHEELQANTEGLLEDLGLSYHVLKMCTGDMGEPQVFKYDTEVWMPSRKNWGEVASNSIMGDFQTRRLKIKYRTKTGQTEYAYSLNDTAIASPRFLIAILENYQQADGSILIPEVLRPLTGFSSIGPKK